MSYLRFSQWKPTRMGKVEKTIQTCGKCGSGNVTRILGEKKFLCRYCEAEWRYVFSWEQPLSRTGLTTWGSDYGAATRGDYSMSGRVSRKRDHPWRGYPSGGFPED